MVEHLWATRAWRAMGSDAKVLLWAPAHDADDLADWAIIEAERLEQCWSRFRADSELSEWNRLPAGCEHVASEDFGLALLRARDAWAMTGGRFDATVHADLVALGYDRPFAEVQLGAPHTLTELATHANFGALQLDTDGDRVVVRKRHAVTIDLGGIGKGLATDLLVAGLLARGASSACLSLGGDLRVAGPGPDDGADHTWRIPVEDAATNTTRFTFPLVDEAIAQSTTVIRRWPTSAGFQHHIIDPTTGRPSASRIHSAVVTAPHTWQADVFAKVAIIVGETEALECFERAGVDGWLFRTDGTIAATPAVAGDAEAWA